MSKWQLQVQQGFLYNRYIYRNSCVQPMTNNLSKLWYLRLIPQYQLSTFQSIPCRPQMGPMLAPWTLLSGICRNERCLVKPFERCLVNAKHLNSCGNHASTQVLTHWDRVTYMRVTNLTIIGSDNALSPYRHQAIICINVGMLWIKPLGTKLSENLTKIHTFSFKNMHFKMSSAKLRPFCLGFNVLTINKILHNMGLI